MQYIIFGAAKTGSFALDFLGHPRVKCFLDNYKAGTEYCDKEVIDFETFLGMDRDEIIVVIAAEARWAEMAEMLEEQHFNRYFRFVEDHLGLWTQMLPSYYLNKQFELVSYNRLLAAHDVSGYKRIAILGANELTPYLISEIAFQNRIGNICQVISFDDSEYQTVGVPCLKWEVADKNFDCLIVNCLRCQPGLDEMLDQVDDVDVIDLYDADYVEPAFRHPELIKYKDIHKGKRIFVIGNGPSLRVEDLDTLHRNREICIAANKIYKIYDRTKWRADYIGMYDQNIVEDCERDFGKIPGTLFVGDSYHHERPERKSENVQYFHCINSNRTYIPNGPKFSEDMCYGFYDGYTVTYTFGIQFASYVGAKEIYLLGCDHNFTVDHTAEGNHFIKDYFSDEQRARYRKYDIPMEEASMAYFYAGEYLKKRGIRIFNATRGGALEVFERVDFDSLFSNEKQP
ncbi:MAG: DUF115 domain-containing protein [Acetatifactor muris]|nr:DUF115 domain-containing protein [Acetatifactor muris]MCM1526650.1 DUF115 domain-containing protein [Bacteroides sp.]